KINLQIINQLFGKDWGLYKTTTINLQRIVDMIGKGELALAQDECDLVISRIREINDSFEKTQKPVAWQLRDRVGTRVKWYMDVEEVEQ
ncbi:MAG: hypothetical protein JNM02_08305, partial [Anaerolineales bacterium]|nr:hypothetical protein [Anaerolineales bacterium]